MNESRWLSSSRARAERKDRLARWLLGRAVMHPLSFLQKRGHLAAVARGRRMFERVRCMTPARFDLMYLIHQNKRTSRGQVASGTMFEAEARRRLGLARQTVWKMVERLVELGLVDKRRDETYRRRVVLALTDEGTRVIRQAFGAAFTEALPLPPEAPVDAVAPRFFRRLAKQAADAANETVELFASSSLRAVQSVASTVPSKMGREVARTFTAFAMARVGGGRRGRRRRHLQLLERMVDYADALAAALGNEVEDIYGFDCAVY